MSFSATVWKLSCVSFGQEQATLLLPEPKPLRQNGLRYLTLENAPVFSYGYFYEKTNPNPARKNSVASSREYFRSASE